MVKILILQPESVLKAGILELLQKRGYSVRYTYSANEAIHMMSEEIPDVVVTEIDLSGEATGWDLLESIRETPEFEHIWVIVLTERISREDEIQSLNLGADHFMTRPFYAESLELRIANAVKRQRRQS